MATLVGAKKIDSFSTNPKNLTILGWDIPVPEGWNHHTYQPKRNAQIKREKEKTQELVTAIKAAKAVVQPVRVCKLEVPGHGELQVVGIGRRRTVALRIVNEDQAWLDANNDGQPIELPLMLLDADDPLMFEKIRAENSGRLDADPLDTAEEIAATLAGMDQKDGQRYAKVAAMYGKNHQFARAMEKVATQATPEVRKALKKGPGNGGIGLVSAQELATIADPEEQNKVLAEAIARGDTSTKAIKGAKSAQKGNKTKGSDGTTRRKDREINKSIAGLRLAILASKTKEERFRLEVELNTLLWVMSEAYEGEHGKEVFAELPYASAIVESEQVSEKEGEKAEVKAEREAEKAKKAAKAKKPKAKKAAKAE